MATKSDLREALRESRERCDAAADLLSDPSLDDHSARIVALEHLGYRSPAFLDEGEWSAGEEDDDYGDEDWEDEG